MQLRFLPSHTSGPPSLDIRSPSRVVMHIPDGGIIPELLSGQPRSILSRVQLLCKHHRVANPTVPVHKS